MMLIVFFKSITNGDTVVVLDEDNNQITICLAEVDWEEVSTQEQANESKESEVSKEKIYKRFHWINIDASIVEKDSSNKTVTLEVLLDEKYEKIIVPTTMVYPQDDGSCKVSHDFFQSKLEELEYKKLIDI